MESIVVVKLLERSLTVATDWSDVAQGQVCETFAGLE